MTTYRLTIEVRKQGAIGEFEGIPFQVTTTEGWVQAMQRALDSARKMGYEVRWVTQVQEWLPHEATWLTVTRAE